MELSIKKEFIMKGDEGNIIFDNPTLNENSDLAFKGFTCGGTFYSGNFILNEKFKGVEIASENNKKVVVKISDIDLKEMKAVRKAIKKDLTNLVIRLISGEEALMFFKTESTGYVFFSNTILENGEFSPKYLKSLIYSLSVVMKNLKKEIDIESINEFNIMASKAIKKIDLAELESGMDGNDIYYKITVEELAKIV